MQSPTALNLRLSIVGLIGASLASAATFYVAPAGSDSNPGTQNAPWKTLQHAVDELKPGDTALVESGRYAGFHGVKSGEEHKPVTIQAAPNAKVLINSPGPHNSHRSNVEVEDFNATVTDWVIEGFEISGAPVYGIDLRGTDRVTVRNNRVHGSGLTGIFTAFSNHVLIEKNESYENGEHGIYQSNSSEYPIIRGNRSHHNAKAGIHMNGDLSEGPPGIIRFATVEDNVISENGLKGASAINCDGVDDSIIRNNVMVNNHASGISLYGIDGAHSSSNNRVTGNGIIMAPHSRFAINIPDDGKVAPPVANVIEQNVLCTPDNYNGSIFLWKADVKGFSSDKNVVVDRFAVDNDEKLISFAQWQKLGYDKQSMLGCDALLQEAAPNQ